MQEKIITLNRLPIGSYGRVCKLQLYGAQRRRLLDLGLIKGTEVEALQRSPLGDPTAYYIRGTVIAIRDEDAAKVFIHL